MHIIKEINIDNKKSLIIIPIIPKIDDNEEVLIDVADEIPFFNCNDLILTSNITTQISKGDTDFSPVVYNSPDIQRIIENINYRRNEEQIRKEGEQTNRENQEKEERLRFT
jgi:hypothetical protein